jgi:hypothetical protein
LRLKVVSLRNDVQPCTANGLGLFDCWECLIVGVFFIVEISLAKNTMATTEYRGIILLLVY